MKKLRTYSTQILDFEFERNDKTQYKESSFTFESPSAASPIMSIEFFFANVLDCSNHCFMSFQFSPKKNTDE